MTTPTNDPAPEAQPQRTWQTRAEAAEARIAELERERDEAREQWLNRHEYFRQYLLDTLGVEEPCKKCGGIGRRTYGDTTTWRHGAGGQQMCVDVCDGCWGTGDAVRKGPDLRHAQSAITAANAEKENGRE